MYRTFRFAIALLLTAGPATAAPPLDLQNPAPALEAIRQAHDLPGLGAAIVTGEGVQVLATTGVRKKGDARPVTDGDLWHLGSCTKAMTATMIARLVEKGELRSEQTLGETFPDEAADMSEAMQSITLTDLLSHTSGLPFNFNLGAYARERDPMAARQKVLREAIAQPLLSKPGEKFLYSNWGYTLAGHMAEQATGKSWEKLMEREVFKPLEISTAGFGGIGTPGKIDQPWPHQESGRAMRVNGPRMDNVPTMGPAGTIHMSLADWGKFVAEHLKGHRGESEYLKQATFEKLHTPVDGEHALGWMAAHRPWAGGTVLNHTGDNTMNYATVWMAPEKNFAVLVVTNQSGAHQATDEVVTALVEAWSAKAK